MDKLTCGHPESEHGEHTRGYAELADGSRICYACAEAREKSELLTHDTHTAYLVGDTLTGWPGWVIARMTRQWNSAIGGFMGRQTIVRFQAVDVHGQKWYGTSPGNHMYARMHKSAGR